MKMQEKPENKQLSIRELTRLVAIMTISGVLLSDDNSHYTIMSNILRHNLWKEGIDDNYNIQPDEVFLMHLVEKTLENKITILNIIEQNIENKKIVLSKLDKTIVSILMLGCFEILEGKTDIKIIISQYVIMGGCFFSSNETSIINAILQNIHNNIKK